MLVLTRKNGESVCISDDIEVKVLAVRGGTVRLGISAPSDVVIRREEISYLPEENKKHREPGKAAHDRLCSAGPK